MRWIKRNHKYGDTRVIKRFALFPITVHTTGHSETRWLAIVYIRQRYCESLSCLFSDYWSDEEFVDRDAYYDFAETINNKSEK